MRNVADPKLLLRLAHSHREKAQALLEDCARTLAEGSIDAERHAELVAGYRKELAQAESMLERFRDLERVRMVSLQTELRSVQAKQARLPEEVSAGKLTAAHANDRNRDLAERIAQLETRVREARTRIDARTAEALGGFIDLPFERYAVEMAAASRTTPKSGSAPEMPAKRWEMVTILAACFAACFAVFMPWAERGGEALSLFNTGLPLPHAAASGAVSHAWVLYLVLPWLALPVLLRVRGVAKGWGILICGLLLLAGAVYPAAIFGTSRMHEGDVLQLLAAFRAGEALYGASALLLIVLGSLRVSPWRDTLGHSVAASGVLAGGVALVFLAGLALAYFLPATGEVRFDASFEGTARVRIAVHCLNEGESNVALVVPWPDSGPDAAEGFRAATTYGVHVYVRERGADAFRLLPASRLPWSVPGLPVIEGDFMEVERGMRQDLVLDLRQLSSVGADATSIRLEFVRGDGALAGSFESDTSGRYLSPPPESREPVQVPAPPSTPAARATESPAQAAPPVTETPPVAETPTGPTAPAITVEYTGAMGDKIAVRVTGPEPGASKTRLLSVGDEVAPGWYLDAVESTPHGAAIRLESGDKNIVLLRGENAQVVSAP